MTGKKEKPTVFTNYGEDCCWRGIYVKHGDTVYYTDKVEQKELRKDKKKDKKIIMEDE